MVTRTSFSFPYLRAALLVDAERNGRLDEIESVLSALGALMFLAEESGFLRTSSETC